MCRKCFSVAIAALCLLFATRSDAVEPTSGIPCDNLHTYAVKLPNAAFNPGAFSVSAWVKTNKPSESQGVLDVGAPSKFFSFYVYGGGFRMLVAKKTDSEIYGYAIAPAPAEGKWTHYCGTYDGETIRVYLNGKLAQEKEFSSQLTSADYAGQTLRVGADRHRAVRHL